MVEIWHILSMNNVKWSSDQQDRKTHQEGDEARTQTDMHAEGRPPEPNKTNKGATMADPKQSSRGQGNTTTKKRIPAFQTTTPLQ